YTFLWKYENSSLLFERPPNVLISKWLPQNDILAHPNLKLFITHGGILSIHETIWHGVPALGVPVLLDQFSNIEYCVGSGFAEEEDITKIERNSFKKLIIKMINDPKYKENVKLHSKLFRDQIDSPLERAVWWTEFVMRHPNMTFMSPPYTDVSPFIRHSWDRKSSSLGQNFEVIMRIFLIFLLPGIVQCANILFLEGVPSPSHHVWMKTLIYALAERGHNITSISVDIEENPPKNVHYLHLDRVYEVLYDGSGDMNYVELGRSNVFMKILVYVAFTMRALQGSAISTGYQQLLNYPDDFKFDLIINDFTAVSFALPLVGGVATPSYVPYIFFASDLTSFKDRLTNFVALYVDYFIRDYYIAPKIHSTLGKDFPNLKDVTELDKLTKIVLLNKDSSIGVPEQSLPNVVFKGVVIFSLGTNVMSDMLDNDCFTEILEAFRALPDYTFLFKTDVEKFPVDLPKNVVPIKWLPQNDVLAHPKVKLFITHCGLLSVQEALWHGVPMIGIPIISEQFDNIRMLVRDGLGEHQDLMTIERHAFQRLIERVLKNPKYGENAKARSSAVRDQKESPLERAVWWTEYVLRHPNMTHMRSDSVDRGFIQRHSWDIVVFIYTILLILLYVIYKTAFKILRKMTGKEVNKHKQQ
uniref:Putative udp-glucoronosyl and udp-glucosyl transferase n=1 Tax=Lutzomyia longipalpis TaxID=7200 RepID=A0A1B0CI66_LUTLO